ncbi:MAG: hypothetical protein K8S00_10805, partial [Bacteroidales bacterium]|nr:hypothetical protein [Bacteroidales bacterium]
GYGYKKAKDMAGQPDPLNHHLPSLYKEHKKCLINDHNEQEKKKLPYREKVKKLSSRVAALEKIIENNINEVIPAIQKQINSIREDIADIRKNPEKYLDKKVEKTSFYIGVFILFFLSLYLFVFYSSASYSGFFRVFEPGVNLREAMLDANTFYNAWNDGPGEFMFILLMPFVFFAMGYLIHKFTETHNVTNYLKIILLLALTFVFDGFLAYKIAEGLYSVNQTLNSEEYTVYKAFNEVNFWVVIFAGFVAYIVWGLVFDFVIKAYQKLDKLATLTKVKNETILEKEQLVEKVYKNIHSKQQLIDNCRIKIADNERLINNYIIDFDNIVHVHHQFMTGYIKGMIELNKSRELINEASLTANYCLETEKYEITKN